MESSQLFSRNEFAFVKGLPIYEQIASRIEALAAARIEPADLQYASTERIEELTAQAVNVWVRLPNGIDYIGVVEPAATEGVLIAPGEPVSIRPGNPNHIRFNAGSVSPDKAACAARVLTGAIRSCDNHLFPSAIYV